MRWTLHFDREAVQNIYQIPKEIWREIKPVILALQDEPFPDTAQSDDEDPSRIWIALPGDYVLFYEIIDERHVVKVIDIE